MALKITPLDPNSPKGREVAARLSQTLDEIEDAIDERRHAAVMAVVEQARRTVEKVERQLAEYELLAERERQASEAGVTEQAHAEVANRPPEDWYPVAELAQKWRCSKNHVYDLIAKGELRSVQLGIGKAKTRVPQSAIAEYEQRRATIQLRRAPRDVKRSAP